MENDVYRRQMSFQNLGIEVFICSNVWPTYCVLSSSRFAKALNPRRLKS
jgi:hypothetical protein